eukprot:CAMPEP_0172500450 /NCGR_PEP_ID=MMETSP1066-20121228/138471_1 /TAXON_ID=671091 /ORGANISM="Coscinodiscus wailesii, Strain CCMP2513" /LENGTH=366 /DNA_ID=CAMNT_0013274687 /DNA_START=70 /DNA_END=1170 /DNA_ORIENTATION=+
MTNTKANYGGVDTVKITNVAPQKETADEHSVKGIIFMVIGAFSFSIMFLLVKVMASTNPFTLVFYRSLVQIAISYFSLINNGEDPLGPPDTRFWLVIRGIFGAAAVIAWFVGIQILPLPDAVTLQFTTPPFAAIIAVFMVGEEWMVMDKIGAIVCLSGVALIAHPTWLFGSSVDSDDSDSASAFLETMAVLVTTGGAAMAGVAYVCVRKIGDRASANVMVLYYGILSIPIVIVGSGFLLGSWTVWIDPKFVFMDYVVMFFMGIAGYVGQWFTNLGLQLETAGTATLVTTTQIVWTYSFEILFLHEALNMWSIGGTCLIIGYMLIMALVKMINSGKIKIGKVSEETRTLLKSYSSVHESEGVLDIVV